MNGDNPIITNCNTGATIHLRIQGRARSTYGVIHPAFPNCNAGATIHVCCKDPCVSSCGVVHGLIRAWDPRTAPFIYRKDACNTHTRGAYRTIHRSIGHGNSRYAAPVLAQELADYTHANRRDSGRVHDGIGPGIYIKGCKAVQAGYNRQTVGRSGGQSALGADSAGRSGTAGAYRNDRVVRDAGIDGSCL